MSCRVFYSFGEFSFFVGCLCEVVFVLFKVLVLMLERFLSDVIFFVVDGSGGGKFFGVGLFLLSLNVVCVVFFFEIWFIFFIDSDILFLLWFKILINMFLFCFVLFFVFFRCWSVMAFTCIKFFVLRLNFINFIKVLKFIIFVIFLWYILFIFGLLFCVFLLFFVCVFVSECEIFFLFVRSFLFGSFVAFASVFWFLYNFFVNVFVCELLFCIVSLGKFVLLFDFLDVFVFFVVVVFVSRVVLFGFFCICWISLSKDFVNVLFIFVLIVLSVFWNVIGVLFLFVSVMMNLFSVLLVILRWFLSFFVILFMSESCVSLVSVVIGMLSGCVVMCGDEFCDCMVVCVRCGWIGCELWCEDWVMLGMMVGWRLATSVVVRKAL